MSLVADHLGAIRARSGNATLIAVSQTRSVEEIRRALIAGQRIFGENRVQEAQNKFPLLRQEYPDIELHLIGALQTNKAQAAVELFNVIQTLDRPALAQALAKAMRKTGRTPRLYVEVNIGSEPQKAGVPPHQLEAFLNACRKEWGLLPVGLMCIPPQDRDPTPFFHALHEAAKQYGLLHISMGMSSDFEKAVACGATEIRVGSAIFGERTY